MGKHWQILTILIACIMASSIWSSKTWIPVRQVSIHQQGKRCAPWKDVEHWHKWKDHLEQGEAAPNVKNTVFASFIEVP